MTYRFNSETSKKANERHYKTPFKRLYTKLKNSAQKKSIEVELSYEDFLEFTKIPDCYYCGDSVLWVPHGKKAVAYNLDRRDNEKGYTKQNSVVCCKTCNFLKSKYNSGKFLDIVYRIAMNTGICD